DDDTPLGDIGLQISPENREEADIGYTVIPAAQGKGIASEALRAVCDYAFNQTGVKAINAWVLADNTGSVRVLEKTGFVRTQVLEKAYEIDGVRYDDWGYRLERGAV
ncbi:GNAT family N-acetyltransferase, partial [Enterobacter cancerogenus]